MAICLLLLLLLREVLHRRCLLREPQLLHLFSTFTSSKIIDYPGLITRAMRLRNLCNFLVVRVV
jgi:hypothetical protein